MREGGRDRRREGWREGGRKGGRRNKGMKGERSHKKVNCAKLYTKHAPP